MTDASRPVNPRTGKPMPTGGRLSREVIHARKVAAAHRKFQEALPLMLEKLTSRILAADTSPGVFVQSLGTLDKILAYLPKPAESDTPHMDALRVAQAMSRIAANPAKYVVQPVDLETIRAEHARLDEERAALEAKILEVRRLRNEYHELQESRPLPDRPKASEEAPPPEVPDQPPIPREISSDLASVPPGDDA